MSLSTQLFIAAGLLFAVFAAIGAAIARRPADRLDELGGRLRAHGTAAAIIFTKSGRSRGLTFASLIAFAVFYALHKPLWVPGAMVLSQLSSQGVVELFKAIYGRPRPDYWVSGPDAGHSYPSGHSATAVVFFIGWAVVIAYAGLSVPVKAIVIACFVCWAVGVMWSRLALGAHYLSDVAAGALVGAAWLCVVCALVDRFLPFLIAHHAW